MIKDILELEIPDHDNLKDVVWSLVDNAITSDWYRRVSNDQTTSITLVENPWIKIPKLEDFVLNTYKENFRESDENVWTELWLNIYRPGGIQGEHQHNNDRVVGSWCYFTDVPPNSGTFIATKRNIELGKEGTVVFFPPWMLHKVTENKSEETRVTVAGNIILR